jgi:hypothetical protein
MWLLVGFYYERDLSAMPISAQRIVNPDFLRLTERKWRGMQRKEALKQLNLGQSVAEFDQDLKVYFVETETYRSLVHGSADIVAGDKGTGKSALFRILLDRYTQMPELNNVEVVPAFNPDGDPVFKLLTEGKVLTEGQYRSVWKAYILSLAGNWLLKLYGDELTPSMVKLDSLLKRMELRESDETPSGIFKRLFGLIKRLTTPKKAGIEFSFDEAGMPVTTPHIEFEDPESPTEQPPIVRHVDSLSLLNTALQEAGLSVWLVLDRLDEAFAGYPATEIPALRALFRTFLDMTPFDRVKLKMFVRKDLFRKVTQGDESFVNLSHINDRKVEIIWDDDDLLNLLIQRVRTNAQFMDTAQLTGKTNIEIFYELFPKKVQEGAKRPETFKWMITRIRDGQNVKPPRNLIDLVRMAQSEQQRKEEREPKEFSPADVLIEGEAIAKALKRLSRQRVEDTLLAESGAYREHIEKFRHGKAEHNLESLMKALELPQRETLAVLRVLLDMGFLERIGDAYKIPMLYRDGLDISQGKAYQPEGASGAGEDEEEE